jgi:hypothetical protein
MKSIFKRTLAAASSSILVLSQLSAVAATVNVSAADEAPAAASSATTIDKEFVLFVPIDEETPWNGLHSDWNDKLEAAALTAGAKSFTVGLDRGKKYAKKAMLKSDRVSSATADEILAAVSEAKVETDGKANGKATIEIADLAPVCGELIEQEMRIQNGGKEVTFNGKPVVVDWSKLTLKCTAIVDVKTDFDAKTVSYEVTLKDENGKEYKDYKAVEEYVLAKVDEAAALLKEAGAKNGGDTAKFNEKVDKYVKKAKNGEGYIAAMIEAVKAITASASDIDTLYTDYSNKLIEAAKSVNAPEYYTNKAINKFNAEKPATASAVWTDEKVQDCYDAAVDIVSKNYGDIVDVQLKLSDIQGIVENATSASYKIDGYTAEAILEIEDDKADEVKAAIEEKLAAENKKLVSFKSAKKITAKGESDYGMKGSAFYDVERIITIETEAITTTTTSEPAPSTTTTTEAKTDVTGTETTASGTGTTVSGTETTVSGTETTVSGTETTVSGTETTVSGSETTAPVTSTTSETPVTSTTPATYVSFEFKGIEDKGYVYWSEEDGKFDLSGLSVSLHFYESGVEQPAKTVEVTDAFKPEFTSPSEMTMPENVGCSASSVYFVLKDAAAVQKAITDAGYDQALIEQEGIKDGLRAGKFTVYLVLRGDTDLNGEVSVEDVQLALVYYTETAVAKKKASVLLKDDKYLYNNTLGEMQEAYFPYSHYAMDVADGNGEISVEDVQDILRYYTEITVAKFYDKNWDDEKIVGKKVVPMEELHKEPLTYDTWAAEYLGLRGALPEEG